MASSPASADFSHPEMPEDGAESVPPMLAGAEAGARPVGRWEPSAAPPLKVLVTVPVHNEVERLEGTIEALDAAFRTSPYDYVLSVAEDGSTDGTKEMLANLRAHWPKLVVQQAEDPLGRGRALRELWAGTPADIYCFTDADLAAGPTMLVQAVEGVAGGEAVVVGSRYAQGAVTTRPPVRSLVSRGYNRLLRFSFGEEIRDHQCGLKAFSSAAIRTLLPETREDSWFWDTEILILALDRGFAVRELPVRWVEHKASRTHYQRLLSDFVLHGTGMLRLKSRIPRVRGSSPRLPGPSPLGIVRAPTSLREPRSPLGLPVGASPEFGLSRAADDAE